MRIVLLSTGHPVWDTYPDGGGIQHQVLGMATEMAKRGHEVHIICRSVEACPSTVDGIVFHPVNVRLRDEILSVLMFSREAADAIDSLEPDVVSAFERFSAYFPSRRSYPMTFTTHNYDAFRYYRTFAVDYRPLNVFVQPWKRRLEESVMRRSVLVIALTKSIKRYLESVGVCHVEVIPNGVFVSNYQNMGDGGYILYSGRLDAPKRVDLLIRAFALMNELHDDYFLRIVGRGPHRAELIGLARECGVASHVEFREWVSKDQLVEFLGNCTVFVLPSQFEALPITLLEAMASSKTVIGSDTPGPKDVIVSWTNGVLFENGNVEDLTRALTICLQDKTLRESMGRRARHTIEMSYDFSSITDRTLQAYSAISDNQVR